MGRRDVETGKCLHILTHDHVVTKLQFNDDCTLLVTLTLYRIIKIWDVFAGECLYSYHYDDDVIDAKCNNDYSLIATSSYGGPVELWSIREDCNPKANILQVGNLLHTFYLSLIHIS